MSAYTHELLQRGNGLSEPIRQALNEAAMACNTAAIAVNHAFGFQVQYTTERDALSTVNLGEHAPESQQPSPRARVVDDLERIAGSFYDQTLVALTRAAAHYAGYASQVATELLAGRAAPLPEQQPVRPSDVITALDLCLPKIEFDTPDDPALAEKNAEVLAAHHQLWQVVSLQLRGENPLAYDDPAAVRAGAADPTGISETFPNALHQYAATLTFAISVLTEIREPGSAGSASTA
ncbi:hypothetical protein [Actinoplanes sp. HUAS TT8]|uniref:hypothetical protein n=1 Tax=Actinoplanes sp. HUAS TT8 TaxID=3447453 RepID=UPI003F528B2F